MEDIKQFHHLLQRQIKKAFGEAYDFSPELLKLLKYVSESYTHADEDRALIERSLELSSSELSDINASLQKQIAAAEARSEELEKLNNLMVGRELKMIELKKELKKCKENKYESRDA